MSKSKITYAFPAGFAAGGDPQPPDAETAGAANGLAAELPPLCVDAYDLKQLTILGITQETIRENQLYTRDDALWFPYRDLNGDLNGFSRRRLRRPLPGKDGKPIKYLQPKGTGLRAYYPARTLDLLGKGSNTLYITEGEKKALLLSQCGWPAVGIGGIWCGCKPKTTELIDDLDALDAQGLAVYIVFDHDPKPSTRAEAWTAAQRLCTALLATGAAEVYYVQVPPGPDPAVKRGCDDYIAAEGIMAFLELVAGGVRIVRIVRIVGEGDTPPEDPDAARCDFTPPVLGEAAYRGPIGAFLRAVHEHTEATDAAILAHLLPAVGTAVGPGPTLYAGNPQYARLNTVLVGPTSTGRKGTATAPVDELMLRVDAEFWKAQRATGLSTGEGLIKKVADGREWNEEDKCWDVVPVEKRLYVVEPEFSKVLAHMRREANILSMIFREAFDSGNLATLVLKDPLQAWGAHISITGHITPEELLDRFKHVEMANGFGNRILWFAVKSDKVIADPHPLPAGVFTELVEVVRRVAAHPAVKVPLAGAAMGKWGKEIYPRLRDDLPGMRGALVARAPTMVLRMALIYYLLDRPNAGLNRKDAGAGIQPVHLDAALAVWDYCSQSVEILFRGKTGTFLGDKILDLLRKAGGTLTKKQLNTHLSNEQKRVVGGVLGGLEEAGAIRKVYTASQPCGGRPATAWEIVTSPPAP
jgi:hypothetical protein